MPNNPFYSNPGSNPYTWSNTYAPGASYAPQTGGYMAGNQTSNLYQNQLNRFQSIPGRLVNNLDEITPQEVPMDGSVSLFPTNDFSAIYAKTWTKDDTIADLRTQVNAFNLAVSQRNQNDYLIGKLQPCPTPAYVVPNPNCCYNYGNFGFNGCGCNNGCC